MFSVIGKGVVKSAVTILAIVVLAGAMAQTPVFAQGQGLGSPGVGPPPGKGGGRGETTANNLSYPASFTGLAPTLQGSAGSYTLGSTEASPGVSWSYGCNKPEIIGQTTYPNTSCVNPTTGAYLSFAECQAVCGYQPDNTPLAVERIYWQTQPANIWQAQSEGPATSARAAGFVNWGDNLETGQWTVNSIIRVETTPFYSLPNSATLLGFQMWHVSGQGTNELWGVRATAPENGTATIIAPYIYNSPYTIIHTSSARLNLALLGTLSPGAVCGNPPPISPFTTRTGWQSSPAAWEGALYTQDLAYTPELNIGGKFVYGYNWNVRNMQLPVGLSAAGWWRLTFYTPDRSVNFLTVVPLTEPNYTYNYVPSPTSAISPREDTGPKYFGTVDPTNNLTYMDICLNPSSGGGRR